MTPALRPAPPPREINTVRVAVTWTALSLIGFLVLLFFIPDLRRNDAMIWLWSSLAAFLIGLWGLGIAVWQGKMRLPDKRRPPPHILRRK
ncbi:hypothetical protein BH24ACT9_BH24ACT9_02820 [soil metagenome]